MTRGVMTLLVMEFKRLYEIDDGLDRESFMTNDVCRDSNVTHYACTIL